MSGGAHIATRFRALDGWRGVCALLVAAHHIEARGFLYWLPVIRNAWLFVDFFFVLSGFVIAHAYGDALGSGRQVKGFVIRRLGRLWPLHVAMLAALIALECLRVVMAHWMPSDNAWPAFTGMSAPSAIVTNLLLIQSFGLHPTLTWNGPAWSIGTEFYTYLIFALVCLAVPFRRASLAVRAGLALLGAVVLARFAPLGMKETTSWGEFRCLYGFFTGTLAYDLWRRDALARWRGTACEIVAAALALALVTLVARDDRIAYAAPPVFALAVLAFAREDGAVSRLLTGTVPAALGRWSYSIYMVHILVVALMFSAFQTFDVVAHATLLVRVGEGSVIDLGTPLANDAVMLGCLAVVVGLSRLTYKWIEQPGQRLFTRWARPKPLEIAVQTP